LLVDTVWFPTPQVMTGASSSVTVTVKEQDDELLPASVAVQVTVVTPGLKATLSSEDPEPVVAPVRA